MKLEKTEPFRDHYDPEAQCVRLSPDNYDGKSVTAVAIAAHEVGHAIQFHRKEKISRLRNQYLPVSVMLGKMGTWMLLAMPIVSIITRSPSVMVLFIAVSLMLQLAGAMMYLIVLPEEWDASFNKALPILIEGDYLPEDKIPAARQVLRAAALTYFAGALANVANIGRWLISLRR